MCASSRAASRRIGAVICERDPARRASATRASWPSAAAWCRTRRARTCCRASRAAVTDSARRAARCFRSPGSSRRARRAHRPVWRARAGGWCSRDRAAAAAHRRRCGTRICAVRDADAREADGVVARWFQRHGCRAAIVRPDHYVFGGARRRGLAELGGSYPRPSPASAKSNNAGFDDHQPTNMLNRRAVRAGRHAPSSRARRASGPTSR